MMVKSRIWSTNETKARLERITCSHFAAIVLRWNVFTMHAAATAATTCLVVHYWIYRDRRKNVVRFEFIAQLSKKEKWQFFSPKSLCSVDISTSNTKVYSDRLTVELSKPSDCCRWENVFSPNVKTWCKEKQHFWQINRQTNTVQPIACAIFIVVAMRCSIKCNFWCEKNIYWLLIRQRVKYKAV